MAKIHADRIAEKLGVPVDEVKGRNYRDIMSEVIFKNTNNIQRAVGRLTGKDYEGQITKLKKKGRLKEKTVLLPSMDSVLPKRSVAMIKSADSGKLVTQTLADRMNKSLRDKLKSWQASGKPLEIRSGIGAGKINPELIREFESELRGVFSGYTRADPDTGVPGNVKQIAVTEIRTNIDAVKAEYHKELERRNPGVLKSTKTWRQNRSLSKNPREEHRAVDGVSIARDQKFKVPNPNGGYDMMDHPHSAGAPPEQTIGCNCDAVYKAVLI